MNFIALEKLSIIKSRPFPQHQKYQVTIACSKMIQSRDAWKSKRFHLHMTKSILFLLLQVCSVFYLATNMNGTLRGLFYHLFSVIYASLFFAVCFVETLERLPKNISVFENLHGGYSRSFRHRHRHFANPLQGNLLYCTAHFANLERILGFSVPSIMHFSEARLKQITM